jgi:excisionase family DNA binding protein
VRGAKEGNVSTQSQGDHNELINEPRLGRSVSIDQAAHLLNVSRRTIYNRIREGRLQTIRTMGGSQRVLVESLYDLGFRPQAFSTSASAVTFSVRPVNR